MLTRYGEKARVESAKRAEELAADGDLAGVANWLRTLESIPPWWASFRDSLYAEVGDPVADRERLMKQSPLFNTVPSGREMANSIPESEVRRPWPCRRSSHASVMVSRR